MPLERHEFDDPEALAEALAARVATAVRDQIAATGSASIAVSGGSTPARFLSHLAESVLDWSKVTVTLVDERWVGEASPRSNARMVRERLLMGRAEDATFMPLYDDGFDVDAGARQAELRLTSLPRPFAAVVLGMGEDGHTASWFADGDCLEAAADPTCSRSIVAMRAASAGEPRITLTLPVVLDTALLVVHIEGENKRAVLERALQPGAVRTMPVRAVLRQNELPVDLYWCP